MSYIIGISAYYHDSSACLFKDGELIFACGEERFTGIKHDASFPNKTLKHIFEKYPTLESFGWTQYTPYFNDGEACVFYADTDYITVNDEYLDDASWSQEIRVLNWGTWNQELKKYEGRIDEPNPDYDPVLSEASNEITSFLNNFDNDFYLSKFGDHAQITVTRDGVDISDYDHD